ncbi:MAG: ArsR/SmtB family transcription factor [Fimbriimonadaceae bacterium]
MHDVVLLGKALSDPTRVRIIYALMHSDLCVCEMVDCLELGQSTLSNHLQTIRQAGIVTTTRRHKMVSYELLPESKDMIRTILKGSEDSLNCDKRVQRDLQRLADRLTLRKDGICNLGPGQLDKPNPIKDFITNKSL